MGNIQFNVLPYPTIVVCVLVSEGTLFIHVKAINYKNKSFYSEALRYIFW